MTERNKNRREASPAVAGPNRAIPNSVLKSTPAGMLAAKPNRVIPNSVLIEDRNERE